MTFYVRMTDKFMSGWGSAKGKANVLIVVCDNFEQAETIERNAYHRSEMMRVAICDNMPRQTANQIHSVKQYADLGEIWKRARITVGV